MHSPGGFGAWIELARTDIVRNQIYPRFSVTSLVPVLVAAAGAQQPKQELSVIVFVLARGATARGQTDSDNEPAGSHVRIEAENLQMHRCVGEAHFDLVSL